MTLVDATTGEVVDVQAIHALNVSLQAHEAVIAKGFKTFVAVGTSLLAIRDEHLYRMEYATFEAYCSDRWGLSRKRAYDLTGAAEVVAALSPMGDTPLPANERQARALLPLKADPEKAAEAMREAAACTGGKPTAEAIKVAVDFIKVQAEQRAEDRAAIAGLVDMARTAGLDMDPERQRQRGEFARLCRDLSALPSPAEFIARHGEYLRDEHTDGAVKAFEWLETFVYAWENR